MNKETLQRLHLPPDFGPRHKLYRQASFRNKYDKALAEEGALPEGAPQSCTQPDIAPVLIMRQCSRVGIDVTRRCNFRCATCFYRHHPAFGAPHDEPLEAVLTKVRRAKARGCDHVVLVGWGEPCMWKRSSLLQLIKELVSMGMTSSIITNGSLSPASYGQLREAGLNHLHISVHGLGEVLDRIVEFPGAAARQEKLMKWLKAENWPWRMNMTAQLANYQTMPRIAETCVEYGCRHIISLGFLPHYEWGSPEKVRQVAVHPAKLRPYIEDTYEAIWRSGVMFTVRYHPMCHLREDLRKYVVNAQYVLYDPWEWEYEHHGESKEQFWRSALVIGGSVAINEEPCRSCDIRIHCGGWNRVYCRAFGQPGEVLRAVKLPEGWKMTAGWLHLQNPANLERGWF
jgi:MoaA/NifB/PqqE/SkfB family radical SAM enzyme